MAVFEVSIIAITHNQQDLVERAIKSLLEQDFLLPYEIIIVNDSSTDATGSIVEKMTKGNQKVKVLTTNCKAPGLARIEGLKASSGKYVTFLDCDDYYHPKMVDILHKVITKENADIVNCSHYYVRKKKIGQNRWRKNKIMNQEQAFDAYFKDTYFHSFMWSKMFKGEVLRKTHFHLPKENIMFEDTLMCFDILFNSHKIVSIKNHLYYYNKTNKNSISNTIHDRVQNHVDVFAAVRYMIDKSGNKNILKLWNKYRQRRKFSILADIYFQRKNKNKVVKYKEIFDQLKSLNGYSILEIDSKPFSSFIKNTFHQ